MADAAVGDDVYGEDPTARTLEDRTAAMFGKEAALFVPSGTMANQIALMVHCRPGDEVICGKGAHLFYYEGGAGGAWAGVQFAEVGANGLFTVAELEVARKPPAFYLPRTRLVAIENTHNRSGGRVFPQTEVCAIADRARAHGLGVHLDGARIWNAAIATKLSLAELAAPADTVSACFSKGLGAPVGSVIVGTRDHIEHARRLRRMLGGAMRQVGVLCAAALYALDHHFERLAEDHANAKHLAQGLARAKHLSIAVNEVETNIVNIDITHGIADDFVHRASEHGVLVNSIGPTRVRAVTHLGVSAADIERAMSALGDVQ